jgi:hypothetical protein
MMLKNQVPEYVLSWQHFLRASGNNSYPFEYVRFVFKSFSVTPGIAIFVVSLIGSTPDLVVSFVLK